MDDNEMEVDSIADRGEAADNGYQPKLLQLETIASRQGALLMEINAKCLLPVGTKMKKREKYVEVRVPRLKKIERVSQPKLHDTSSLPVWMQPAFQGMHRLNIVQSRVYEAALFTEENILLCAPTGTGKSSVAVLTILHRMAYYRNDDGSFYHSIYKIVYLAPTKALVAKIVNNLSNRLKDYSIKVTELSGDQTLTGKLIKESQIIVATPEEWDDVTIALGDCSCKGLLKLLIIDQIHLLHDTRGPLIESIVARTVRQLEKTPKMHIRLVGLSTPLPNYEDVASFLSVDLKKGSFNFDNSYRPCPVDQLYVGFTVEEPIERSQLMLDFCYEEVMLGAGKHQTLIFVQSIQETCKTAYEIMGRASKNGTLGRFLKKNKASRVILNSHVAKLKSHLLIPLLYHGFAFHHAGLDSSDRQLIEELYLNGHVQVLVSTSTLAWGVNLRSQTVIIKGTQSYNTEKRALTEVSPLDVMQMLGRAGRKYDTHCKGVIITGYSEVKYYVFLMNQRLPIESQFLSKLAERLFVEIALENVRNVTEACHWLKLTYMHFCMLRSPKLYGLAPDAMMTDNKFEESRVDLVHSAATLLETDYCITYDTNGNFATKYTKSDWSHTDRN